MSITDEAEFLAPFLETARCGGVLVVSGIHRALEEHLGHDVALATAYNLLHRHGWRKLAPDKRHIDADVQAQEDWKKTAGATCPNRKGVEKAGADQVDVPGRGAFRTDSGKQAVLVSQARTPDMLQHDQPGVYICLRSCDYFRRPVGQPDLAASQYRVHADILGRDIREIPGRPDSHGA